MATNTTTNAKFITGTELINSYLRDVRQHKVLTQEEEQELFRKYNKGDEQAKDKIVMANQRFVYSNAKIYATDESDIMDYVNEGNIGLLEAIKTFDVDKGFKFITHAVWYIKRSMNAYMYNSKDSVIKSNNMKIGKKADKIRREFMNREERLPSLDEICDELQSQYNIEINDKSDLFDLSISSINENIDDEYTFEDDATFCDATSSYNDFDVLCDSMENANTNVSKNINEVMNILPEKNKFMLEHLFGLNGCSIWTIEDIADELDMYVEDVRSMINITLEYIKQEHPDKKWFTAKH